MRLKEMYTEEELLKGVRNPFFHEFCKKVEVVVKNEDYALFEEIAKINGETPESLMRRCLAETAKMFRENDD